MGLASGRRVSKGNENGSAIVSGLIAAGVLMGIVYTMSFVIPNAHRVNRQLASAVSCQGHAANILRSITNLDNSRRIRNFIANTGTNSAGPDPQDPFCKNAGQNGCDSIGHVDDFSQLLQENSRLENYYGAQNIRGAMSWALATYNNRSPAICSAQGEDFPIPAALRTLNQVLPADFLPDSRVKAVKLLVESEGAGGRGVCVSRGRGSGLRISPKSQSGLRVTVHVQYQTTENQIQTCTESAGLNYQTDSVNQPIPPATTWDGGGGIQLEPAPDVPGMPGVKCTCQKAAGCTPAEIFSLQIRATASEPGSSFACRRYENGVPNPGPSDYQFCANMGITPLVTSPSFNSPTAANLQVAFSPAAGEKVYRFAIRSIDTSGNFSPNEITSASVITRNPTCPDPATVDCNRVVLNTCGTACGTGTRGCTTPTPRPTPVVCPLTCEGYDPRYVDPDRGELDCVPTCRSARDCEAPFRWGCNNCYAGTPQNQPNLRTIHLSKAPECRGIGPNYCFLPASCPGM